MPSDHAKLGPSNALRWLNCTASASLEERFPNTTSKYAEEGTLAHSIVEERLKRIIKGKPRGQASARLKKNELYKPVMEDYCDQYVDYVVSIYDELVKQGKKPTMLSECRVDYSDYVPEGFGTTDTTIVAFGTMYVFDFKYGQGVRVDARDNPQLRLYALGAYLENSILYDIDTVKMFIVQPRVADGITSDEISVDALIDWAETYVKPRAQMAWNGEGDCVEGEWCKFCKAKTICRARAIKYLRSLEQVSDPKLLSDEDLATLLPLAEYVGGWADELKTYMLDQAINRGAEYPGYKLVEGRSRRVILNPKALADKLTEAGYKDIFQLKGISDLEAVVGVKEFAELAGGLVDKPAGNPTLVTNADPRPALGNKMFDDEEEENVNG